MVRPSQKTSYPFPRASLASLLLISALTPVAAAAQSIGVVVTETNDATQELFFRGAAVDRGGEFVAVNTQNVVNATVLDFATATTIPFETSVLGVPQAPGGPLASVPPSFRAAVLEDFLINSNLQNPSVGTGILLGFANAAGGAANIVNGPGADVLVFELSPPAGVTPPSGGPTVLGGDPFLATDPASGGAASFFAGDFDQFGGAGASGSLTFFTSAGAPFASLDDLESGDLASVITVPGLNVYAVAFDISDLGIAEGDSISTLQLNSIASTGFGPDFGFVAGVGQGASDPAIVDGALQLSAFGPFTSDFDIDVRSPQGGTPLFSSIDAPLFTSITIDGSDPLIQSVVGDFLLDGSAPLSPQASIVGDYVTSLIGAGASGDVFAALESVSDFAAATPFGLEAGLLALSPEAHASAPALLAVEEADARALALRARFSAAAEDEERAGFVFWSDGYGLFQDQDGDSAEGLSGFDPDIYGFTAGVDWWFNEQLLLGVSGGYSTGDADFDSLAAEVDLDTFSIGGHAVYFSGPWRLGLAGGYGFGEAETSRQFTFANAASFADYDIDQIYGVGELAYTAVFGGVTMEPQAGFVFVNLDRETFAESGAPGFDLLVSGRDDVNVLFFEPRLKLSKSYTFAGIDMTPEISGGWRYDIIDDERTATAALLGSPIAAGTITVRGAPAERSAFAAGGAVRAQLSDRLNLFVRYEGLWGDLFTSHDATGGFQFAF
ncbi:MAG: autotransporter outer membrane beta-barrel domain-containing protein [Pseudomonadota bacterium]